MNGEKIFYSLNINDVQTVAEHELSRKLNAQEINIILDKIPSRINWYDAISDVIQEFISEIEQ